MQKHRLAAFAVILGGLSAGSNAASISYVAAEIDGAAAPAWRTASVPKPNDIDGDNVYGTYAAVQWQVQGNYSGSTISHITSGNQYRNAYAAIDNLPDNGATDSAAGIALDEHTFQVNADLTGKTLRVGVMRDVLTSGEQAADTFKGFTLQQTVGGSAPSASSPQAPVGNGQPDMYFFDITDAHIGDQYQILALNTVGGTSSQEGYLSFVLWDVATTVPEPASFGILILTGFGLTARRVRGKN
jgi:hypothetical protein